MATPYRPLIEAASVVYALNARLVEAVVMTESSGKTHAYRYEPAFWTRYMEGREKWLDAIPERVSASYGLMQVMFPVALEHGYPFADPEFLFIPSVGIDYGCRVLSKLLVWSKGNEDQALAAYNGGKGGNGHQPYRNAAYVQKVRAHYVKLQGDGYASQA